MSRSSAASITLGVANYNHAIFTPATGNTVNVIKNSYNIINPSGTLVALTINMAVSPNNNDLMYIKFTQAITTLSFTGGTVQSALNTIALGGLMVLVYDSGTSIWY